MWKAGGAGTRGGPPKKGQKSVNFKIPTKGAQSLKANEEKIKIFEDKSVIHFKLFIHFSAVKEPTKLCEV